jgi:hypothetical protein
MRLLVHLVLFWAIIVSAAFGSSTISVIVCVQSIGSTSPDLTSLAEIRYNTSNAEFLSYEAPYFSPQTSLVRIGICDTTGQSWLSSLTVTSAESFSKAYSPNIVLSLDTQGNIIGAACRGVKVDAAHTRDFGPKVKVVQMKEGKKPDLNKPILASKEGRLEEDIQEKTFVQKYVFDGIH